MESHKVAYRIAQCKNTHTIKQLILPAALDMVSYRRNDCC